MATGRVKWFNNAKGYGFVRPDAGGDDLFVHYSYIQMDGYKTLKAGQAVNYEIKEVNKGQHAVNLTFLPDDGVHTSREIHPHPANDALPARQSA